RDQRKVSKLNQTIHRLSIRLTLAEHENTRLKEALINKRLRRKQGKALPLEQGKDYQGGAVFWSPRKVKEARDCQQQQELEEKQQQLQKADRACVQEDQKQAKLQEVQRRRAARAAARVVHKKEKARKAAKQASRAAACRTQQLQQALKTAQRGKRRSLKTVAKAGSKKRAVAQPQDGGDALGAAAALPPSQSRHGQAIKLPAKYR
ncbi:hypothetical protein EJ02DRAFT_477374, partial [Clathrospora elynae]